MRCLTCRCQTENQSGQEGDGQSKPEDLGIDRNRISVRHIFGDETCQNVKPNIGECQTSKPTDERKHYAFNKKLLGEAKPIGSDGKTQSDFFLSRCGAGEQEICDIGAGNKENETDRA